MQSGALQFQAWLKNSSVTCTSWYICWLLILQYWQSSMLLLEIHDETKGIIEQPQKLKVSEVFGGGGLFFFYYFLFKASENPLNPCSDYYLLNSQNFHNSILWSLLFKAEFESQLSDPVTHHVGCKFYQVSIHNSNIPPSHWLLYHTTYHLLFTPSIIHSDLFACQLSTLAFPDHLGNFCLNYSRSPVPSCLAVCALQTWEFLFTQEATAHWINNTFAGLSEPQNSEQWLRLGIPFKLFLPRTALKSHYSSYYLWDKFWLSMLGHNETQSIVLMFHFSCRRVLLSNTYKPFFKLSTEIMVLFKVEVLSN